MTRFKKIFPPFSDLFELLFLLHILLISFQTFFSPFLWPQLPFLQDITCPSALSFHLCSCLSSNVFIHTIEAFYYCVCFSNILSPSGPLFICLVLQYFTDVARASCKYEAQPSHSSVISFLRSFGTSSISNHYVTGHIWPSCWIFSTPAIRSSVGI